MSVAKNPAGSRQGHAAAAMRSRKRSHAAHVSMSSKKSDSGKQLFETISSAGRIPLVKLGLALCQRR